MNTPNKLTLLRVLLVPLVMVFLLVESIPHRYLWALLVFVAASFTDFLDGNIARKRGLVTTFGKFLDPLADKMLTTAAFLGFIKMDIGWQVTWIAFIVLFREFLISSLRLVVLSCGGKVISANIWGKCKTVSQRVGIIFALAAYALIIDFHAGNAAFVTGCDIIISILFWISAVLCIISGIIYLLDSKEYIDPTK